MAASRDGRITVGWIESEVALGFERVMLQTFSGGDLRRPTASAKQINVASFAGFWLHHLHIDATGKVTAEYEGLQDGASMGVYTQAFDGDGQRLASEQLLSAPFLP